VYFPLAKSIDGTGLVSSLIRPAWKSAAVLPDGAVNREVVLVAALAAMLEDGAR
jgi:hypothetical protein